MLLTPTRRATTLTLATIAILSFGACGDDDLESVDVPIGATYVSQVISRDLVLSEIPDSAKVALTFTSDSTLTLAGQVNSCFLGFTRNGVATWMIVGGSGCTEACCDAPITEEIFANASGSEFSLNDGTVTTRRDREAVVYE